jgi:hypothetical protein
VSGVWTDGYGDLNDEFAAVQSSDPNNFKGSWPLVLFARSGGPNDMEFKEVIHLPRNWTFASAPNERTGDTLLR